MNSILKGLSLVGLVLAAILIMLFAGVWILLGIGFVVVLFLLCQAFGIPMTVKSNGRIIGYVRFFHFHPKE